MCGKLLHHRGTNRNHEGRQQDFQTNFLASGGGLHSKKAHSNAFEGLKRVMPQPPHLQESPEVIGWIGYCCLFEEEEVEAVEAAEPALQFQIPMSPPGEPVQL